jgi:hypothetical protein
MTREPLPQFRKSRYSVFNLAPLGLNVGLNLNRDTHRFGRVKSYGTARETKARRPRHFNDDVELSAPAPLNVGDLSRPSPINRRQYLREECQQERLSFGSPICSRRLTPCEEASAEVPEKSVEALFQVGVHWYRVAIIGRRQLANVAIEPPSGRAKPAREGRSRMAG